MESKLDPKLHERLENIVALLCVEVDALIMDEECKDSTAALRAISDAVVILENYLYPELRDFMNAQPVGNEII